MVFFLFFLWGGGGREGQAAAARARARDDGGGGGGGVRPLRRAGARAGAPAVWCCARQAPVIAAPRIDLSGDA